MNVQVLSDQVLLNHYLSGDRSAISKLIERHSRRVKDYIHMMVKDCDVADDIFQETFIKAVRVIDEGRYTDNGKFLSWILRIAHNQVIDHFRAQRQNKSVSEAEAGYDRSRLRPRSRICSAAVRGSGRSPGCARCAESTKGTFRYRYNGLRRSHGRL